MFTLAIRSLFRWREPRTRHPRSAVRSNRMALPLTERLVIFALLAVPCTASAADSGAPDASPNTQATYYVSPEGSDCNPGTLSLPFRTLTKARDVVETVNGSMTGDIVVTLRGGTYPLNGTLSFGAADSGTNGFYVRYVSYPGETPLLTGGQPIRGWTVFDSTSNIWQATGVTSPFRQLYVNGTKAIRARSPNLAAGGAPNFDRFSGVDHGAKTIEVSSSYVSKWNNLTNVEMHLMASWADQALRLASYTTSGSTAALSFQNPESDIMFARAFPLFGITASGKGQCFYFENALEFLDQPGEWYLDESKNTLYYEPRAGEDLTTATVVAPMVETLVSIMGTDATTSPAHHLVFQGLTFAHSTWMETSNAGFLDNQAGQYNVAPTSGNNQYVARPAAGVLVANANNISFERNVFGQMAATGLDFYYGTHDDSIEGNVFTDIGGSGISVGKFTESASTEMHVPYDPADASEICTNETVKDNYVTNVTTEIQGACGIAAGYPRFIDIEHNEVSNVNYTGISVGFGWTSAVNAMSNNKINYNDVHDVTNILADGAAIYTLSNQDPASQMEYNYLHDFKTSSWADYDDHTIYLDQETSGYTVSNNVQVNCPQCPKLFLNSAGSNTQSNNAGTLASTISGAGIESAYADIKNNLTIPIPTFSTEALGQSGQNDGGAADACSTAGGGDAGGFSEADGSQSTGGAESGADSASSSGTDGATTATDAASFGGTDGATKTSTGGTTNPVGSGCNCRITGTRRDRENSGRYLFALGLGLLGLQRRRRAAGICSAKRWMRDLKVRP